MYILLAGFPSPCVFKLDISYRSVTLCLMVNTGRPSPACALCRRRKIKCDQVRPSCSQCKRSKVTCPGYRSNLELRFRDNTAAATRGAVSSTRVCTATTAEAPKALTVVSTVPDAGLYHDKPLPMRFLDTTFQELTLPFCLDYFFGHGTYGILGDSLIEPVSQALQASSQDDAMVAAVRAVGSAALANMRGCKQELVQARSQYCHAVKLAGESIRRGNISSPLNLVLTVLLLSYFEVSDALH